MEVSVKNPVISVDKNLRGSWVTNEGEAIILTPTPNNLLLGTFEKNDLETSKKENYEIVGYYKENLLSFVVDMSERGFCISWVGKKINSEFEDVIEAQWTITQNAEMLNNSEKFYDGFVSGKKVFRKVR